MGVYITQDRQNDSQLCLQIMSPNWFYEIARLQMNII